MPTKLNFVSNKYGTWVADPTPKAQYTIEKSGENFYVFIDNVLTGPPFILLDVAKNYCQNHLEDPQR